MKKSIKSVLAKSLAVAMAFSLAGIAPNTTSDAAAKKPSVTKKVTVTVGKTKTVKVKSKKKVKKTTWSLNKKGKKIVSLSKKKAKSVKVKGKKAGKATLTAKIKVGKKTYKKTCKITVKKTTPIKPTPTQGVNNPTAAPTTPSASNKPAEPTPGIQKDDKFKVGDKDITVDDADDSVYPITISELNEMRATSEQKKPALAEEPLTDGKSYNRDGSVTFTSNRDYNSAVGFYLNPCTDASQLEELGEDGDLTYHNGEKDISAYDYIRVNVTTESELNVRVYNDVEQFDSGTGWTGNHTALYEGGWEHTADLDDVLWPADDTEHSTQSAGRTVKPEYVTRTAFIPISSLVSGGADPKTVKAIAVGLQGDGAECTINYIDLVKVKYDTKVTGIEVTSNKTEIAPGKSAMCKAAVTPADATRPIVTWSSSDESIATVNFQGTVTSKADAEGEVTITATATDGSGVSGSTKITVKEPDEEVEIKTTKVDLSKVVAKTNPGSGESVAASQSAAQIDFAPNGSMLFVDMSEILANVDLKAYDQIKVSYQLKNADGTDADAYAGGSAQWYKLTLVSKGNLNGYTDGVLDANNGNLTSDTAVFDLSKLDAADAATVAGFNLQMASGIMAEDQYMTITDITLYKAEEAGPITPTPEPEDPDDGSTVYKNCATVTVPNTAWKDAKFPSFAEEIVIKPGDKVEAVLSAVDEDGEVVTDAGISVTFSTSTEDVYGNKVDELTCSQMTDGEKHEVTNVLESEVTIKSAMIQVNNSTSPNVISGADITVNIDKIIITPAEAE